MQRRFENKTMVITGGTTGIGEATAILFKEDGGHVYILDIETPDCVGSDVVFKKCDVSDFVQVKKAVDEIQSDVVIDYAVLNAGVHFVGDVEDTPVEVLDKVIDINLKGTFFALKSILPRMRKQNFGSIVLMGSDQSFVGKASSSVYGATKGAIAQLTKSTAIDYAKYNIRVNCVCPGSIETPLLHRAVDLFSRKSEESVEDICEKLADAQPLGRVGTPEEVAKTILFLCSDSASFTTGSLYSIDGGYVCGVDRVR